MFTCIDNDRYIDTQMDRQICMCLYVCIHLFGEFVKKKYGMNFDSHKA